MENSRVSSLIINTCSRSTHLEFCHLSQLLQSKVSQGIFINFPIFPWFSSAQITCSFSPNFLFFHRHSNKHPGNQSLIAANSPASDSPRIGFCCISQQPKGYSSGKNHEIIKKQESHANQVEKWTNNYICCGMCSLNVASIWNETLNSSPRMFFERLRYSTRSLPVRLLPQLQEVRYKHIPAHSLLKMKWTKTCMETWPSRVPVAEFLQLHYWRNMSKIKHWEIQLP